MYLIINNNLLIKINISDQKKIYVYKIVIIVEN